MPSAANDPAAPRLQVGDEDLRRYVGGAMEPARRRAIEGFLACNPDLAARVMSELHRGARPAPRPRGRRLTVALLAATLGACAASAFGGWTAAAQRDLDGWREADGDTPPAYVEEAAESRQASQARAAMVSQVETTRLDAAEIRRTLRLDLPRLPPDWRILDVQVYPTDEGPSVNVTAQASEGYRVTLFVVRAGAAFNDRPELARRGREVVAFWERGNSAYVLSGDAPGDRLLADARILAAARNL